MYRLKSHKIVLYCIHYHPKVHITVMNLIMLDFFFFATRALLHTRDMSFDALVAFACLSLLSADISVLGTLRVPVRGLERPESAPGAGRVA